MANTPYVLPKVTTPSDVQQRLYHHHHHKWLNGEAGESKRFQIETVDFNVAQIHATAKYCINRYQKLINNMMPQRKLNSQRENTARLKTAWISIWCWSFYHRPGDHSSLSFSSRCVVYRVPSWNEYVRAYLRRAKIKCNNRHCPSHVNHSIPTSIVFEKEQKPPTKRFAKIPAKLNGQHHNTLTAHRATLRATPQFLWHGTASQTDSNHLLEQRRRSCD